MGERRETIDVVENLTTLESRHDHAIDRRMSIRSEIMRPPSEVGGLMASVALGPFHGPEKPSRCHRGKLYSRRPGGRYDDDSIDSIRAGRENVHVENTFTSQKSINIEPREDHCRTLMWVCVVIGDAIWRR